MNTANMPVYGNIEYGYVLNC